MSAPTLSDAVDALARLGCKPTKAGNGYKALCPVHESDGRSHTPSLTVAAGDTQPIVVCCQAGCDGREILKVLGVNGTAHKSASIVATYRYQTAEGIDVREKLRYEPKDFRIRHRDASGNWVYKAGDGPAVLYRLPELKAAIADGRTVFIAEGEKDCDRLAALGLVATCNIEGAAKPEQRAKWRPKYTEQLTGAARVVLLPDNDDPGRAHMRHVAEQLRGKVADIRSLELSGLPDKGDVSDWLDAGGTVEELERLASEAPEPASVVAVPDSESGEFTRHDTRLRRKSGSSEVLKSLPNAITICENLIPGLIGFNAFRQRIEARIPAPWRKSPGAWGDYDTAELAALISSRHFPDFSPEKLLTAVMVVARRNEFNPAQDRLRALAARWDGVERLATWLADYLNAELTPANREYLAEIGAAWLKGVVARVLFPGCKRDDVLVMRSPQGYLKSTAAQAIADAIMPDAFTDCIGNIDSKDAKADIRGVIIAELGELAALSKSSIEGIKAFVATRSDHFRESYGKLASDYPRTVSFIGTTNDERFLKDPTGNRRWWPVTITAPIDIPRLESALPKLLGEAASRVLAGDAWYVANRTALQQAETIRSDCFDHDVWTEAALRAAEHMADNDGYATVAGILEKMQVHTHLQTTSAQIRVGGILRVAGWTSKRRRVCRRLIVAWSPQGVHPSHRVNTEGDTQKHSQTAGVHPVSPCSPYFGDKEKNEGGEPTTAATNRAPTERDIDRSTDIGCTPCNRVNTQSNSGDSSITLPVHPSVHPQASRVNRLKTDTPPTPPDISPDTAIASPAESQGTAATCADKRPDIPGIKIVPPVCQPSGFYPFRYVTKCDKPTPIMPESGYGDPVGCSHCGARWGGAA